MPGYYMSLARRRSELGDVLAHVTVRAAEGVIQS